MKIEFFKLQVPPATAMEPLLCFIVKLLNVNLISHQLGVVNDALPPIDHSIPESKLLLLSELNRLQDTLTSLNHRYTGVSVRTAKQGPGFIELGFIYEGLKNGNFTHLNT